MTRSPRDLQKQVRDTVGDHIRELPVQAARYTVLGVGRALMLTDRVRKDVKEVRDGGLVTVLDRLRQDAEHLVVDVVGKVTDHLPGQNGQAEEELPAAKPSAAAARTRGPAARSGGPAARSGGPAARGPAARPGGPAAGRPTGPAAGRASGPAAPANGRAATRSSGPAAGRSTAPAAGSSEISVGKPKPSPAAKPPASSKPAAAAKKPAQPATAKPATPAKSTATAKPKAAAPAEQKADELPVPDYYQASLASVRARLRGLEVKQVVQLRDYERSHAARADFLKMYENRITKLRSENT